MESATPKPKPAGVWRTGSFSAISAVALSLHTCALLRSLGLWSRKSAWSGLWFGVGRGMGRGRVRFRVGVRVGVRVRAGVWFRVRVRVGG